MKNLVWSVCALLILPSAARALEVTYSNVSITLPEKMNLTAGGNSAYMENAVAGMGVCYEDKEQALSASFFTLYDKLPEAGELARLDGEGRKLLLNEITDRSGSYLCKGPAELGEIHGLPTLSCHHHEEESGTGYHYAAFFLPDRVIFMDAAVTGKQESGAKLLAELAGSLRQAGEEERQLHYLLLHHQGLTLALPYHWKVLTDVDNEEGEWLQAYVDDYEGNRLASLSLRSLPREAEGMSGNEPFELIRLGNVRARCFDRSSVSRAEKEGRDPVITKIHSFIRQGRQYLIETSRPVITNGYLILDLDFILHHLHCDTE